MTTKVSSQQDFYKIYKDEVQGNYSDLTDFEEGSLHDITAGALTTCQNELSEFLLSIFRKTYFSLAEGDDLEYLAVDHFGSDFAKPKGVAATGSAHFARPNADLGNVFVAAGTIVKTKKDPNGVETRFKTVSDFTMTGTEFTANIEAVIPGLAGNVGAGKIIVLETALTDNTVSVDNLSAMAGGKETLTDAEYRVWITNKIIALAGATEAAVKAAALSVAGVANVALTTVERVVIDYDIATNDIKAGSTFFRIPYPVIYVSDANGNYSQQMIDAVNAAIFPIKACGVRIQVYGAAGVTINWSASLALNVSGPNYAALSQSLDMIVDTMTEYINSKLGIGDDFIKETAKTYVMSIWGPAGTNDLVTFSTSVPAGDTIVNAGQKPIAGAVNVN